MAISKVISNESLSEYTYILRTERPDAAIKAGQCFSVGTSELGINREYSMYSDANAPYVDFLIREVPEGRVSSALRTKGPGSNVEISGPFGEFCLAEEKIEGSKFIFIASGTGIAPFHSFVKTYPNLDYKILHGIRHESEEYDSKDYIDESYISFISQPKTGISRRVTDGLSSHDFAGNEIFYLCGNRNMIVDCITILRDKKIHGDSIFMETFF
jgi:NAD(P)H-flavin reductase